MPRVGFEPTIAVFEREKGFRTVDIAATVAGVFIMLISPSEFWDSVFKYGMTTSRSVRTHNSLSSFRLIRRYIITADETAL
jgi:hypothetical protein